MGEHLPNDKLEQFLKETLGAHQENPPDSVWKSIESDLPATNPSWTFKHIFYWAGSVAAVSLILMTFQYLYFKKQLDQLEVQIRNADISPAVAEDQTVPYQPEQLFEKDQTESQSTIIDREQVKLDEAIEPQDNSSQIENISNQEHIQASALSGDTPATPPFPPKSRREVPSSSNSDAVALATLISLGEEEKRKDSEVPSDYFQLETLERPYQIGTIIEIEHKRNNSETHYLPVEDMSGMVLPLIAETYKPIEPYKDPSFFVEFTTMIAQAKGFVKNEEPPINIPDPKKVQTTYQPGGYTSNMGINIGWKVGPRLSIITGLWRGTTQFETQHSLNLRKRDRLGHDKLPPGDNSYDYEYFLNGANGRANVQLMLLQNNPQYQQPDNEIFQIEVIGVQKSEEWNIPFLIEYKWGNGRLKPILRGGVVIAKSKTAIFEFERIELRNVPLELQLNPIGNHATDVDFVANTYLNMSFGMGLAYEISDRLQFNALPTFMTNLTDLNEYSALSGNVEHFGMTANFRYIF